MILTVVLSIGAVIFALLTLAAFEGIQHFDDASFWAGASSLITIGFLFAIFGLPQFSFLLYGGALAGYSILGMGWSFFAWGNRVTDLIKKHQRDQRIYQDSNLAETPTIELETDVVAAWIIGWPFDLIRFLVIDVVRTVKTFVVEKFLKGIYNRISQHYIDKANK